MNILSAYSNALNLNKSLGEGALSSSTSAGNDALSSAVGGLSFKDHLGGNTGGDHGGNSSILGGIGSQFSGAVSHMRGAENRGLNAAMGHGAIDPVQVDTAVVQGALELEQATKVINTFVSAWNDVSKTGF